MYRQISPTTIGVVIIGMRTMGNAMFFPLNSRLNSMANPNPQTISRETAEDQEDDGAAEGSPKHGR